MVSWSILRSFSFDWICDRTRDRFRWDVTAFVGVEDQRFHGSGGVFGLVFEFGRGSY